MKRKRPHGEDCESFARNVCVQRLVGGQAEIAFVPIGWEVDVNTGEAGAQHTLAPFI
ncbi:hypothetical protein CGMCC3_g16394 [Colletotrichum fructicola]|nr:uncharacterized protein CGMCC3_g16394 [Colletotrichum fructicola]KAE9567435.1 hypothetical protein CGMCC3_g16394 [Colletotrichum fructicola]